MSRAGAVTAQHTAPPVVSARSAGLRYVTDAEPGIRRRRRRRRGRRRRRRRERFTYIGLDGKVIRSESELARIRALAVPPAWTDVWICRHPRGHVQATGRD